MPICFVIQPFDKGKFDKRFRDVFKPAIEAAELEPYRVDRDPGVSIPIDEIESSIANSAICLADITTDNPNVWFELGYALAAKKDVVLLCSDERKGEYPFDVHHRSITGYSSESPSDFEDLKEKITTQIRARLKKVARVDSVARSQSVAPVEGLAQHHLATLVSVAESIWHPDDWVAAHQVQSTMERAGFTKIATTLAFKALLDKGLIDSTLKEDDQHGFGYTGYSVTSHGMDWLAKNEHMLTLRRAEPIGIVDDMVISDDMAISDDDVPF